MNYINESKAEPFRTGRRGFLALLSAAVLWTGLPGCRKSPHPLRVAAHIWPGYEFMFLAQREGFLDGGLVTLRETASSTESMKALADGEVDAAALTLDEVLRARAIGVRLSVVLVFDISAGADVLLGRAPIRQLGEIKGKRIGVEEGALGALMLAEALQAAGLQHGDVQVVPLTIDQHESAWRRGEVDVLVCFPPVSAHLLEAGAVNLFDSRQLPDTIVDVLAVKQSVLEENRDAVQHLVKAHLVARHLMHHNPQDSSFRMARHLNLHANEVLSSFKGLVLADLENNRRLLGGEKPVLSDRARKLSEVMVQAGLLPKADTLNALLRADFLPKDEDV
ncbi:MAG TPA: ABC transporter substrate-binding protein [Gallionella sp.]|nr:ABC transporter substrate-binding protein [Gallionella sp.]